MKTFVIFLALAFFGWLLGVYLAIYFSDDDKQKPVPQGEYNRKHPVKVALVRPKTERERALIIADIWGIEHGK